MILVSACLIGVNCRYDGKHSLVKSMLEELDPKDLLPICPEQLGGLSTPRSPAEIVGGDGKDVLKGNAKVMTIDGKDVTEAFVRGAQESLKMAKFMGVTHAVLKSNSPSCGAGEVYDGSFTGKLIKGDGVTTALLKQHGIKVLT
ncbi:protein of unknown function DUF523 [Alkaliphilus metalliredigens QYMF]|uniref:Uncharacterized protein n=1 Tax=Alkaliphilus metalliredigens (strain QYMF) TaxID=293826 RepID=A6TNX1_ALKMQ|nr:DUF523 domain-containing protein [Alkaliphilus metalliredigens]ABR47889.1 protein of unknown function DUF523 [Alkaliphilus metalliredigens QYMF]